MKKERMLKIDRFSKTHYWLSYLNSKSSIGSRKGFIRSFCKSKFERLCPALKIPIGHAQKLKLTQLKNGIKLEKVGKPIKG